MLISVNPSQSGVSNTALSVMPITPITTNPKIPSNIISTESQVGNIF